MRGLTRKCEFRFSPGLLARLPASTYSACSPAHLTLHIHSPFIFLLSTGNGITPRDASGWYGIRASPYSMNGPTFEAPGQFHVGLLECTSERINRFRGARCGSQGLSQS